MDEIMAEQKQQEELQQENEVLDKKQLKAAKKLEKKKRKQKNPDDLDGDEETVGGKILVFFVTIIIILIWLAIFAMLIKLDVGGFGSGVLAPVIKDVPYLNKILPDSVTEEVSTEDSQYAYTNLDDAINRIKELEIELADAQNSANSDADYIAQLEEKAKELDTYKQNEADFEKEKEKWYEDVVFSEDAPDISNYKEYYESIINFINLYEIRKGEFEGNGYVIMKMDRDNFIIFPEYDDGEGGIQIPFSLSIYKNSLLDAINSYAQEKGVI